MTRPARFTRFASVALFAALLGSLWVDSSVHAAPAAPTLWGYGVKPCSDFLAAAPGAGAPAAVGSEEYLRYREWLAGLVTGINLATASDVLRGAELEAALGRIRTRCQAHPREDFFNAAMTLIQALRAGKGQTKGQSK